MKDLTCFTLGNVKFDLPQKPDNDTIKSMLNTKKDFKIGQLLLIFTKNNFFTV